MAQVNGQIVLAATASGKSLSLVKPNPSPPPANLVVQKWDDPPSWAWELVVGNAGRACTVDTNDSTGAIVGIAVG